MKINLNPEMNSNIADIMRCSEQPAQMYGAALIDAYRASGLEPDEIPHWIPVSERMPESGAHVLLCCEVRPSRERYVCDGYYAAPKAIVGSPGDEYASEYDEEKDEYFLLEGFYEVIKNWDDFSSIVIDDFVTHWMPLPQPPKEQL